MHAPQDSPGRRAEDSKVRAYRKWIAAGGIAEDPVFRAFRNRTMMPDGITDRVVALVIKKAAERVGIDADALAGHSLRAGGSIFHDNAGAELGL